MSGSISRLEKDLMAATVFVSMIVSKIDKNEKDGSEKKISLLKSFTATAFEREGNVYRFMAAAHCIGHDDEMCERVRIESVPALISLISNDLKSKDGKYLARLVAIGRLSRNEDFAVMEATINQPLPIVPLADSDPEVGEVVSNVASPIKIGKTLFRGYVASTHISQDGFMKTVSNFKKAVLLSLLSAPGSSGSAIISERHNGIVAILLMGNIERLFGGLSVALPISLFRKFWETAKTEKLAIQSVRKKSATTVSSKPEDSNK